VNNVSLVPLDRNYCDNVCVSHGFYTQTGLKTTSITNKTYKPIEVFTKSQEVIRHLNRVRFYCPLQEELVVILYVALKTYKAKWGNNFLSSIVNISNVNEVKIDNTINFIKTCFLFLHPNIDQVYFPHFLDSRGRVYQFGNVNLTQDKL
jgi:hypothetical protein